MALKFNRPWPRTQGGKTNSIFLPFRNNPMRITLSLLLITGLFCVLLSSCTTAREGCPMNSTPKVKFRR
jgi:hypothetical protein